MKKWRMASGLLMVMGLMACKGNHSGAQIIQKMQVQDGQITYDGRVFKVDWAPEEQTFTGDVRAILSEYNPYAPFNTHVLFLTTGVYSNPEIVSVTPEGKVQLHPEKITEKANGEVYTLHLAPMTLADYRRIEDIQVGQKLAITVLLETDGKITDDQGKYIQYASDPHKGRSLLRVVDIQEAAGL